MIGAYVESLKLRVGTFIGLAAVLGYLGTLPTAPGAGGPALPALGLLFVATVIAAGGAGALNHVLDRDLDARMPRRADRSRRGASGTSGTWSRSGWGSSRSA
jgi:heme O synthase-like polyprenyltransferase